MRVRDLERLLIANGAGAAKLDAITRRLRHSGRLPTGGRGANAPAIGSAEAAAILLALAGSAKGAEADMRLQKLEGLSGSTLNCDAKLLPALAALLDDPGLLCSVAEVRVGRTIRGATFIYTDGTREEFRQTSTAAPPEKFYVEGVLPGSLLVQVALELLQRANTAESRALRP